MKHERRGEPKEFFNGEKLAPLVHGSLSDLRDVIICPTGQDVETMRGRSPPMALCYLGS
jgi:hypothetical protein